MIDRHLTAIAVLRCGFLFACLWVAAVAAAPLRGFHHSAWAPKDGAPVDIWAIAQAEDGELWLGTGAGLFRFDGMRFQRHVLPAGARLASNNITALHFDPDGVLWIGYHSAGASRLDAQGIRHFPAGPEFPRGMVFGFERDADGRLWAAVDEGLARYDQGRWQHVGDDWGFKSRHAQWLLRDRAGTLWVAAGDTVMQLPAGSKRFQPTGVVSARQSVLAEDRQGRVWISDTLAGTRPVLPGTPEDVPPAVPIVAKRFLFDREGALWATDATSGGVVRIAAGSTSPQRLGRRDGLTADMAVPLLQDREGNLWVGTNLGLNQLRHRDVVPVDVLADTVHGYFAAFVAADGSTRLLNAGTLMRATRSGAEVEANDLPEVTAALADEAGGAWLLGRQGLWHRSSEGQLREVALPEGRPGRDVVALAADGQGGLWIALGASGVFRGGHEGWKRETAIEGEPPTVLAADARGGLWLGFGTDSVSYLQRGQGRAFGPDNGLRVGRITSIHPGEPVLVAGEEGLAQWDGTRFRSLSAEQAASFGGITGIVRAGNGDWWLNGSSGLLRMSDAQWRHALDEPTRQPEVRIFEQRDGLPGVALQARAVPTLVMDGEGVLWMSNNQGVAWIDPGTIRHNPLAPPVSITRIVAQDRDYPPVDDLLLPVGTQQLRVDYSAGSLTVPERVRFRYRLEGADEAWQDAGTRRQAFYTNLGPGDYRFQVIAANNDGVWNTVGAGLDFAIKPSFMQSRGFIVTCVGVGVLLLWLTHLMRLREASRRLCDRLEERHLERELIARDLHDTLLQGFQGLMLQFQAVAAEIPASPVRERLDRALDRAEQVLGEGRDRVSGLRAELSPDESLATALSAVGMDYAGDQGAAFRVRVEGTPRPLNVVVQDECYLIGREALVNAFRHAGAAEIEVVLSYARDGLRLQVNDDGRGLDAAVQEAFGRAGHWGLPGMRERAERIGAELGMDRRPGGGTCVGLHLAAALAYRDATVPLPWARLRRWWNSGGTA